MIGFVELRCLKDQNPAGVVGYVLRAEDAVRAFGGAEPAQPVEGVIWGRFKSRWGRSSLGSHGSMVAERGMEPTARLREGSVRTWRKWYGVNLLRLRGLGELVRWDHSRCGARTRFIVHGVGG